MIEISAVSRFLIARIEETHTAAMLFTASDPRIEPDHWDERMAKWPMDMAAFIIWDCLVKRALVQYYSEQDDFDAEFVLFTLAAAWNRHPDFDKTWIAASNGPHRATTDYLTHTAAHYFVKPAVSDDRVCGLGICCLSEGHDGPCRVDEPEVVDEYHVIPNADLERVAHSTHLSDRLGAYEPDCPTCRRQRAEARRLWLNSEVPSEGG